MRNIPPKHKRIPPFVTGLLVGLVIVALLGLAM